MRNAREFKSMVDCCGPEIFSALGDPETKATIDLLNACDMRDQVGSYRVIVSYETPKLEDFSLCILQKNNCFGTTRPTLDCVSAAQPVRPPSNRHACRLRCAHPRRSRRASDEGVAWQPCGRGGGASDHDRPL